MSDIILEVLDGSTIASTEIYGVDKKAYLNIGTGTVFNLKWNAPTLTNDTVDYYNLIIKRYYPELGIYYDVLNKNIGLVTEFFVDSVLLPTLPEQYMLAIYVVAHGKFGGVATSNTVNSYVCKGSGTFVKVEEPTYDQPIMKRAAAFTKAPIPTEVVVSIATTDGIKVPILDNEGNQAQVEARKLLESNDWQVISEGHIKAPDNTWQASDIAYEILMIKNEETNKFEPLEIRNALGNYEPLYTL